MKKSNQPWEIFADMISAGMPKDLRYALRKWEFPYVTAIKDRIKDLLINLGACELDSSTLGKNISMPGPWLTACLAKHGYLDEADLTGADLGYANLGYADLGYADLTGADLGYANLGYANLYHADLGYANLYHANLYHANLYRANLTGANLGYANLTGANLDCADLTGADLTGAIGAFKT